MPAVISTLLCPVAQRLDGRSKALEIRVSATGNTIRARHWRAAPEFDVLLLRISDICTDDVVADDAAGDRFGFLPVSADADISAVMG